MTLGEFQNGIARLSEQFGKNAYSQARMEIIWREIKDFNSSWWERTVDLFLFTYRQPPLFQEFSEQIGQERERLWRIEKAKNEKSAKEFFAGTYLPEEVSTICKMVGKRLQEKVSDKDYSVFVEHLTHAANNPSKKLSEVHCPHCENRGIIWAKDENEYEWVYRCYCREGEKQPKAYPIFNRNLRRGA